MALADSTCVVISKRQCIPASIESAMGAIFRPQQIYGSLYDSTYLPILNQIPARKFVKVVALVAFVANVVVVESKIGCIEVLQNPLFERL